MLHTDDPVFSSLNLDYTPAMKRACQKEPERNIPIVMEPEHNGTFANAVNAALLDLNRRAKLGELTELHVIAIDKHHNTISKRIDKRDF